MKNIPIQYDYLEFVLSNGVTNQNVKTAHSSDLFVNVPVARMVIIHSTQTITFRFNNVNLPAVGLNLGESPYQSPNDFLQVSNIFLTNASGSNSTVKIWLI